MPELYEIFSKKKAPETIKPIIIVDNHEKNSLVASEIIHQGGEVNFKHLEVGDYLVGNAVIERKTISDFISSMINKRLLKQLENMLPIENRILIIEGIEEHELYHEQSDINENAIRGFMLSIILKYKTPILLTKDYIDTAKFLLVLARRQDKETSLFIRRKASNSKEQIQYIVEGFPGIGPKSAKKLLQEFKTIKNIINASQEELEKIIGKKAEIFKLLNQDFQELNDNK
ncbi:MAG: ERCC4 domain-containing protein [Candidatus Pacearchaeota archaeon]|jgi:Fanconi anemia group M protein